MMGQARLLTLAVLNRGPLHGYGIIKEIREKSQGCCTITGGTIYPALRELELEGLIKSKKANVRRRGRVVYKITPEGEKVLARGLDRWVAFTKGAKRLLAVD